MFLIIYITVSLALNIPKSLVNTKDSLRDGYGSYRDFFSSDFYDSSYDEPVYEPIKPPIKKKINLPTKSSPVIQRKSNINPITTKTRTPFVNPSKAKSINESEESSVVESKKYKDQNVKDQNGKDKKDKDKKDKDKKKKNKSFEDFFDLETVLIILGVVFILSIIGVSVFFYFYTGYRTVEDQTKMADHHRTLTRPKIEPDNDDEKIRRTVRYG